MTFKKPHPHILTVWRLRLLLFTLLPSFISACFLPRINLVWWLFTAVWSLAFLFFYIFYYPIKYKKLAYSLAEFCLLVHCGVIYTRVKAMPFTSIQYVTVSSTPLQRLFDISTVFVYSAGSSVHISGVTPAAALELQLALTPESEDSPAGGGANNASRVDNICGAGSEDGIRDVAPADGTGGTVSTDGADGKGGDGRGQA